MKKLFVALLVLLLSVVAALWLRDNGGFVVVTLGEWTLQSSVLIFVGALVLFILALYALVALIRGVVGAPSRFRSWRRRRSERRAHSELVMGLVRLVEGRDEDAKRHLLRHSDDSDLPVLHLLGAAVAAQRQLDYAERDRLIGQAYDVSPRARPAVGMMQAELQVEAQQWEQALATLTYMREQAPKSPRLLRLLLETVLALRDWDRLDHLLPDLRKQKVLDDQRTRELERDVARQRMANAEDAAELERIWGSLPKVLREDKDFVALYAAELVRVGKPEAAENLLRSRLDKDWDVELLRLYGALEGLAPDKTLAQLEKWLRTRPDDPVLLYAAGRQALRAHVWGRARGYLEAAAARGAGPESYYSLAALLEKMHEYDLARDYYRRAIAESVVLEPLPVLTETELAALADHGKSLRDDPETSARP